MPGASLSRYLGLTAAVVSAFIVAAVPAQAQGDDDSFETKFLRRLFGHDKPEIDYRERSPLVLPPSTELPKPEAEARAESTPNWPRDPDAARRRQAASAAGAPVIDLFERESRPLNRDELRRGTTRNRDRSTEPVRTPTDSEMGRAMRPGEYGSGPSLLGMFGSGVSGEKPEPFTGEPSRSRLIDPPTGYRTPASGQPYAPPKDNSPWYNPFSWFDRGISKDR